MKFILILLSFSFIKVNTYSQQIVQNFDESLSLAKEENKNVLMVFSGSDWCKPCIRLRQNILDSAVFQEYASSALVILELDFPMKKKNKLSKEKTAYNENLAEKYNDDGSFPKVILFNADKEVLGYINYKNGQSPQDFVNQIQELVDRK